MSVASKEENTGDVFDASKMNYKEKKKFYNSKKCICFGFHCSHRAYSILVFDCVSLTIQTATIVVFIKSDYQKSNQNKEIDW